MTNNRVTFTVGIQYLLTEIRSQESITQSVINSHMLSSTNLHLQSVNFLETGWVSQPGHTYTYNPCHSHLVIIATLRNSVIHWLNQLLTVTRLDQALTDWAWDETESVSVTVSHCQCQSLLTQRLTESVSIWVSETVTEWVTQLVTDSTNWFTVTQTHLQSLNESVTDSDVRVTKWVTHWLSRVRLRVSETESDWVTDSVSDWEQTFQTMKALCHFVPENACVAFLTVWEPLTRANSCSYNFERI